MIVLCPPCPDPLIRPAEARAAHALTLHGDIDPAMKGRVSCSGLALNVHGGLTEMSIKPVSLAAAMVLALSACTPATAPTASPDPGGTPSPTLGASPTSAPPEAVQFTFGTSSQVSFSEVPDLAAFDALRDDGTGIDVEVVQFADTGLTTTAIIQGQADFGVTFVSGVVAANKEGADLRVFFNARRNEWRLVSSNDIATLDDLDGEILAHNGVGITAVLGEYVEELADVTPEYATVSGSANRVQALINGQIDATVVSAADVVELEKLAPDDFHVLLDYEEALPGVLIGTHYMATRDNLGQNAEAWETLVTYLIASFRRAVEDPEWLAERAVEYLPGAEYEEMLLSAQAFQDVYLTDGGMDPEQYDRMMDFYVQTGFVDAADAPPYEEFMYDRYVIAALEELGD